MKKFFLGMENELLIIKEAPEGYAYFSCLEGKHPTCIVVDPQNENVIYCGTDKDGLLKSEDGGKSWENIGNKTSLEIESKTITALAINPFKKIDGNSVIYVGTEPSMLYYSNDKGETWQEFTGIQSLPSKKSWSFPPRPTTHHVRFITTSYSNEDYLGVAIEAGAFIYTTNQGETWNDRPEDSPIDIHTLLTHPKSPKKLYAACGEGIYNKAHSYAESNDEGQSWQYKSSGLENHPYAYHLAINPNDPSDQIISAAKSPSAAHSIYKYSAVYRKQGESSWVDISEGLPENHSSNHHLAADPTDFGAFYAMNNYGIYHLASGASKWEKLELDWQEKYVNQRPSCFLIEED